MIPSFEKRVRAFAIDTSAATLVIILSSFTGTINQALPYILSGAGFIGFYILPYFISHGQTFGKRIQKIKLVGLEDQDLNVWIYVLRDVVKLTLSITTFGIYLIVAFFVMNEKTSRTIHDYIFKTKMIDLEKPTGKERILGTSESLRKRGL